MKTIAGPFLLDRDVTYLNHGSFGACPRPVLEAQARYREEMERGPVRFLMRRARGAASTRRAPSLAAFVGAAAGRPGLRHQRHRRA